MPSGAEIIGNSYLYRDKVEIHCPEPNKSTIEIECFANKTWLPIINC